MQPSDTPPARQRERLPCPDCERHHRIGTSGSVDPCSICGDCHYVSTCDRCAGQGLKMRELTDRESKLMALTLLAHGLDETDAAIVVAAATTIDVCPKCRGAGVLPAPDLITIH